MLLTLHQTRLCRFHSGMYPSDVYVLDNGYRKVNRAVNFRLTNIIRVYHIYTMARIKDMESLLVGKKPKVQKKRDFINHVTTVMKKGEISWLATDTRSFEWTEINLDKKKFLNELTSLSFKMAHIGIFYPEDKRTEYELFHLH